MSYNLGILLLVVIYLNAISAATIKQCSIPKCEQGCRLEKAAGADCPGCVCTELGQTKAACPTCDQRYLKHYEAKRCKPSYIDGCTCPVWFDCPGPIEEDPHACTYKGEKFTKGQKIPTSNPCEMCYCQVGNLGNDLRMSCIPVECPSDFNPMLSENCYDVYEDGKCCPVDTKCDEPGVNVTEICTFEGNTYRIGSQMYSEENVCLSCLCTKDYVANGLKSKSCKYFECPLDRHVHDFNEGCVPIYHEKTCCPIEHYCPNGKEEVHGIGSPEGFKPANKKGVIHEIPPARPSEGNQTCLFNGKHFDFGTELNIHHPTNCVTCTCSTPPDFTCVHKSCSGPPNDDYDNCQSVYSPDQCCPLYECSPEA